MIYKANKEDTIAELHFHTKETSYCGQVSASDSIPEFKKWGYDLVVVTDHYNRDHFPDYYNGTFTWEQAIDNWLAGYRTALEAGKKCGVSVILGAEVRFDGNNNDYLVYGMTEEILRKYPCLWEIGEAAFSDFAREHGIFFAQAHPYRPTIVRCEPSLLMGVEVFNSHPHHSNRNELAKQFCEENGLIPLCGQDYHQPEALLGCATLFHGTVKDSETLINKLLTRDYEMIIPNVE